MPLFAASSRSKLLDHLIGACEERWRDRYAQRLAGVPVSVPEAADNKRAWAQHLGDHVEVPCCLSREKSLDALAGEVLIDEPSLPRIGDAEKEALWPDSVTKPMGGCGYET